MRALYSILILFIFSFSVSKAQIFVAGDATGANDGTSWTDAYLSLQDAITEANTISTGVEIWIKMGTYSRMSSRLIPFTIDGFGNIEIYGGFDGTESILSDRDVNQNQTIISGELGSTNNTDNYNQAFLINSADNLIDGVFITDFNNNQSATQNRGIIHVSSSSSLTISNCTFYGNTAMNNNGNVFNSGGNLIMNSNSFNENSATGVGQINSSSHSEIINCIFTNNTNSITAFIIDGTFLIVNNTIYNNQVAVLNGGIYNSGGTGSIYNNILWNNAGDEILGNTTNINISNNIIQGSGYPPNNFDFPPGFKDVINGDFNLTGCSPARNIGSNSFIPVGITEDINGNLRIFDSVVDAGAFEHPGFPIQITTIGTIDVDCFGEATGQISIVAAGGNGALEYSIDGSNYNVNPIFTNLLSRNYPILIRDEDGCFQFGNIDVNQPVALQANATPTDASCFGESDGEILISGSGGVGPYIYSTNGVNFTSTSAILNGLTAGAYTILLRDANGCEDEIIVTVSVPTELTITSTTRNISCNGLSDGEITVMPSGGTAPYQYSIDNSNFQSAAVFSGLMPGTTTVTVSDDNGCNIDQDIIVTEPVALLGTASTVLSCNGAANGSITISITGGTSPFEYSLDGVTFQDSELFENLTPATYSISIIDASGCTTTVVTIVDENPEITLSSTPSTLLCNGDVDGEFTISASGGAAPYTYSIDGANFQSSDSFTGLIAGSYTITVRDVNSCLYTELLTISEPDELSASAKSKDVLCNGEANGTITVTGSGGTSPYEYSMDGNTFQTSDSFSGLVAGNYTISTKDANSCTATEIATIAEPNALSLSASFDGQVSLTATGGTAPYTYSSDGAVFQIETIFILPNGEYTFTVKDSNDCIATTQQPLFVTAVNQDFARKEVRVYPNPVADQVHIRGLIKNSVIRLIDNTGRVVLSEKANNTTDILSIKNLKKGIYLLKISSEKNNIYTERLIIE